MAHLILPSKRLVQPYGAADIDQSAPLSRGLVGYINPTAKNFQAVGAAAFKQTSGGLALLGTGSSLAFKNVPSFGSGATLLFVGNWLTGGSHVAAIGNSGAGDQCFIFQAGSAGTSRPRALIRTVSGGGITTAETLGSGNDTQYDQIEVWCARYDGTTALKVYRNGDDFTEGNANTAASGSISTLNNISLGGTNRGSDAFASSGQMQVLGLYWNRALSPAEIKEISRNPWQIFRPVQRRVHFDMGSGGGATGYALSADVGDYLLTGVDAALTYTPASSARSIVADAGVYSLSGGDALLPRGFSEAGEYGSYAGTGQDASLKVARLLAGDFGEYTLNGSDAALTATGAIAYSLAGDFGQYTIAGVAASLIGPADQNADTHDGYFAKQWLKAAEQSKRKIEALEDQLEEIQEQIEEVKAAPEPKRPVLVESIPVPPFEAKAKIIEALIEQAERIRAEIDDEEVLLLM